MFKPLLINISYYFLTNFNKLYFTVKMKIKIPHSIIQICPNSFIFTLISVKLHSTHGTICFQIYITYSNIQRQVLVFTCGILYITRILLCVLPVCNMKLHFEYV